jgi:hypothetical protein
VLPGAGLNTGRSAATVRSRVVVIAIAQPS